MVELTHIDLATEEDKLYHIDSWASLFKATNWVEIKMIAQNCFRHHKRRQYCLELSHKDRIRLQCEAREDYYRRLRSQI